MDSVECQIHKRYAVCDLLNARDTKGTQFVICWMPDTQKVHSLWSVECQRHKSYICHNILTIQLSERTTFKIYIIYIYFDHCLFWGNMTFTLHLENSSWMGKDFDCHTGYTCLSKFLPIHGELDPSMWRVFTLVLRRKIILWLTLSTGIGSCWQ